MSNHNFCDINIIENVVLVVVFIYFYKISKSDADEENPIIKKTRVHK